MQSHRGSRMYLIGIGIVLFLVVLVGYAFFQARHLLIGPQITIEVPTNGARFPDSSPRTEVRGQAQNIVAISLNDRPIFIDEEGYFREQLLLQEGYTIMTLEAEDRFGRSVQKVLHLVRN